mgnify:CR=1 FL=1
MYRNYTQCRACGCNNMNSNQQDLIDDTCDYVQNTMAWMAWVKPKPMLNMKFWVIDSVNAARRSCSTRIRTSNISWEAELTC